VPHSPSPLPTSLSEFESRLREAIDPVRLPSVAYGIAKGYETLLLGALGLANREQGIEATPSTAYSLASVTKPLTTTAVKLLAERGQIDLEAPINDYLGEAKLEGKAGDASKATIRRVADHSAGLSMYYRFFYADEPHARPPTEEVIRRYAKLFTPAGERHHYSNLGYGLLDPLIERVSGRPYAQFMAEEVFGPLDMTRASIGAPAGDFEAIAYGPDGVPYPHYDFDHPGGSAAYASAEDLLKFGRFHLGHGPNLLSSAALADMHRRTIEIDEARGYGLGWGINENRFGIKIVQHTGLMGGVSTVLRLVPELDLVITILTNGQSDLAFRSADDAMAALLPEFREDLAEERANPPEEPPIQPVPSEWFGRWQGVVETYQDTLPFTLDIRSGHEATARLGGQQHVVEELQIRAGRILGVFDGDVRTHDAARRPYRVHLDLKPHGDNLSGAALTLGKTEDGGGGAPSKRYGNALAYWTQLSRG
jgi:CubicO group peptidase (beta-lactamase class C family)